VAFCFEDDDYDKNPEAPKRYTTIVHHTILQDVTKTKAFNATAPSSQKTLHCTLNEIQLVFVNGSIQNRAVILKSAKDAKNEFILNVCILASYIPIRGYPKYMRSKLEQQTAASSQEDATGIGRSRGSSRTG
jgi:hypothetical protein